MTGDLLVTDTIRTVFVRSLVTVSLAAALAACGGPPPITSCEPADDIRPDCRFQNPEDLVTSPAGDYIIVSQYGDLAGGRPGNLVAYAPEPGGGGGAIVPLFPDADHVQPTTGWGEVDCTAPDADRFAPHGIDIEQLVTGEHALYVVNHGGRESVEMFEVLEHGGAIETIWRGCVMAPGDGYFNDLVVMRSGEFRVSQMFPRGANTILTVVRMQALGYVPGFVYHWSPANGFERLQGTDAKFANGVEKSADERFLFVNDYFGNQVVKVDTETGTRVGAVEVASPDNLSWSPTGELLVASHHGGVSGTLSCNELESGSCGFRFQVVAIDPEALTSRVLLDREGAPMGAATVALPFKDAVYLGTFAGDRIARVNATILARAE
jgi:hypothetical protein